MNKAKAITLMCEGEKIVHKSNLENYFFYKNGAFYSKRTKGACPIVEVNKLPGFDFIIYVEPIVYVTFMSAWNHMMAGQRTRRTGDSGEYSIYRNKLVYKADDSLMRTYCNLSDYMVKGEWELINSAI